MPPLRSDNSKLEVQIDGLVVMKLIKHCHEVDVKGSVAQGALLGLVQESGRLEITNSFPFSSAEENVDDEEYQLSMMKMLRQVNVDHLHVGWYQSAKFGNFLSTQLLESQFAYQTAIEESVCLIFDTAKTSKGFLSLRAYRLTPQALELYKMNDDAKTPDFTPETIKKLRVSFDNILEEVPVVIKNSHLVNELLLELSEQIPPEAGSQFLDLGSADVLEEQLQQLMQTVDDLNLEAIKFNNYQTDMVKQSQDKMKYLQKRQQENSQRSARGEEPLADEDLSKLFKPIPPPARLNPLILSGQTLSTSEQVSQFCSQSLAKWFSTEPLQKAKTSNNL